MRTEVRGQISEDRQQRTNDRYKVSGVGKPMTENFEFGSGTRRRPIRQNYAAASMGKWERLENRRWDVGKVRGWERLSFAIIIVALCIE